MYIKQCWKYFLYILVALIVITTFIFTMKPPTMNNETYYLIAGIKIYDLGSLVALIVGIFAFIGTIYSVDKNYRGLKLSSIPDKSANLLIDLELAFNEYKDDEFKLLTEILNYWKDHQKAFRLLTPHFYKEFLKILKNLEINKNTEIPIQNAEYIYMAIIAQITNIALENNEPYFSFIKPELIKDDENIKKLGETEDNYIEFEINKNNFNDYISKIKGEKTQNEANNKFKKLDKNIKKLLKDLKRELEEYE